MIKNIIYRGVAIIPVIIATIFILSSCQKWNDDYSRSQLLNIPEKYRVIGEKHNEGLDFAFKAIKSHYAEVVTRNGGSKLNAMSKDNLLALGKQAAIDFSTKNTSNVPTNFCKDIINKSGGITTRSTNSTVNPKIGIYIQKIEDVLKNEPKSPEDLIDKLNKINEHASQNLSDQDAIAVYAGTVTCYNSYIYWKENFMKWVIAIKYPELLAQYSDDELNSFQFIDGKLMSPRVATKSWWEDAWSSVGETWDSVKNSTSDWWNNGGGKIIVAADAGGAVMGAIDGAIKGAIIGGVGAGPGAIAGGITDGCRASIATSIATWIVQ